MLQAPLILGQSTTNPDVMSGFLLTGVRGMFFVGVLLYFIFAVVVIRQIHVMKSTLITPFSPVIQLIGFVHFLVVCLAGIFLWSIL